MRRDVEHLREAAATLDWGGPSTVPRGKPWSLTPPAKRDNGWVYFVGGEVGCIKIGWTSKPVECRLSDLQCGSPVKLFALAKVRGGMTLEKEYHRRFKTTWSHGEWFERTPEIMAEIDRLDAAERMDRASRGLKAA